MKIYGGLSLLSFAANVASSKTTNILFVSAIVFFPLSIRGTDVLLPWGQSMCFSLWSAPSVSEAAPLFQIFIR